MTGLQSSRGERNRLGFGHDGRSKLSVMHTLHEMHFIKLLTHATTARADLDRLGHGASSSSARALLQPSR